MDSVMVLRRLWRLRALVAAALVLAVLIGIMIPYHLGVPPKSRQHEVGIGSASALIDTPRSQLADLGGDTGSDVGTLSARASLLASLMTTSPIKDEIAQRAGIPVKFLIATPPPSVGPTATKAPGALEASVSPDDPRANVLTVSIPTLEVGQLPIIAANTQAPTPAAAARLADAAIAVLGEHVRTVAGTDQIPNERRLVVSELGPARGAAVSRGPRPLYGVLAAIFLFGFGCFAIVGASSLAGSWRDVVELEREPLAGPVWYAVGDDAHDDPAIKVPPDPPADPAAAKNGDGALPDILWELKRQ